jgi:glycine/D-amino acid oxidase-like deaminating enzyme
MSLQSPWLAELVRRRPVKRLTQYHETDVVVIGGGIAGTSTAAFSLKDTSLRITLIEAGKIGHGATGRNAGQMLTEFERPLGELVTSYGQEEVKVGLQKVETAWDLVKDLQEEFSLKTPILHAPGYNGYSGRDPLLEELENIYWKKELQLPWHQMRIAQGLFDTSLIPEKYQDLWVEDTHESILADLETKDPAYIALCRTRLACTNSAQLSEELIQALLHRYGNRFSLFEESPVSELHLERDHITLKIGAYQVKAKQVVLCTNGFEQFRIVHFLSKDINAQVHRDIRGVVSFMQGHTVPLYKPVKGLDYYTASMVAPEDDPSASDTFVYLTRRPFHTRDGQERGLVCLGGPETSLPEEIAYDPEHHIPEFVRDEFDRFLKGSPLGTHADAHHPTFEWHGLMGYTNGRVRCIGREPCYADLLYNLGCNGIGIMTSIYGGKRIAGLLVDKDDGASLFNPKMRNCELPKHP